MNNFLMLALALAAGLLLGVIFFGGLCWTVRKGVSGKHPALWFLASGLVRMSVALLGFYFVGAGDWRRLAACLCGFVIARFIVMARTRQSRADGGRTLTLAYTRFSPALREERPGKVSSRKSSQYFLKLPLAPLQSRLAKEPQVVGGMGKREAATKDGFASKKEAGHAS